MVELHGSTVEVACALNQRRAPTELSVADLPQIRQTRSIDGTRLASGNMGIERINPMKNTTRSEPVAPPGKRGACHVATISNLSSGTHRSLHGRVQNGFGRRVVDAFLNQSPGVRGRRTPHLESPRTARERIGGVEQGENRLRLPRLQPHECVS